MISASRAIMSKLLIFTTTLWLANALDNTNNTPASKLFPEKLSPQDELQKFTVPAYNRDIVHREDVLSENEGGPERFAITNHVPEYFFNSKEAMWELLEDGTKVWRSLVEASPDSQGPRGCKSFNFAFIPFQMPEGGALFIYDPDTEVSIGPFTHRHNTANGEFWTPVISKCRVILEVNLAPDVSQTDLFLKLDSVNEGYRKFGPTIDTNIQHNQNHNETHDENRDLAAPCNVNVKCRPGWEREERSVGAVSLGGIIFCTGFMVNNAEQDYTPYFITAAHCGINENNAGSLVVYWNWKYDSCNGGELSDLDMSTSGATFLTSHEPTDATIVKLDKRPDPSLGVTYAGWDRSGNDVSYVVGLHFPSADDGMKINFSNAATTTTSYGKTAILRDGNYFRVPGWDVGTTERGSSGSPIFSPNHRVIGNLKGGFASCGNNRPDWYGKFSASMDEGRFSRWLDPRNTRTKAVETIEYTASCGDGVQDPLEVCDSNDFGGRTCTDFGFSGGGSLMCNDDCGSISTAQCISGCGNDIIDGDEVCDGVDIGSATCSDVGYSSGTLKCNQSCDAYDVSRCTQIVHGPEHISGDQGGENLFCKDVSVEVPLLKFYMSGGTGNADLYTKKDSTPTTNQYECRSQTNTNLEECVYAPATPGRYCAMIHGSSSYETMLTVEASGALMESCSNDSQCDDGIECTEDSCDQSTGFCVHTPLDSVCDDGIFCNGEEMCQSFLGCQAGTPPCDDRVGCNKYTCNERNRSCQCEASGSPSAIPTRSPSNIPSISTKSTASCSDITEDRVFIFAGMRMQCSDYRCSNCPWFLKYYCPLTCL